MLTGCDVTSKIGTKSSAMKVNPERFLQAFGVGEPSDIAFKNAERYLVYVIQPSLGWMTFDELRYEMYRMQSKGLSITTNQLFITWSSSKMSLFC